MTWRRLKKTKRNTINVLFKNLGGGLDGKCKWGCAF